MESKICLKCNESKELTLFPKDKTKNDGVNAYCKSCCKIKRNPEYHKNYNKSYDSNYYLKTKDKKKEYQKSYYLANSNQLKFYNKVYRSIPENKEKIRISDNKRYKNNINNKLGKLFRLYIRRVLKGEKWCLQYLGYSMDELKIHIESLWEPWMGWNNYGEWEIDHIIPIDYYIKQGINDPKFINRLDNLRPLLKSHNRSKGNKLE